MTRSLASVAVDRNNNFNLLRAVAATAVLFSHSFALATGRTEAQPLWERLGVTFGTIAVDVFFITSGFLVAGSLLARNDLAAFIRARALRIYPALFVSVALTVFGLGLAATTLAPAAFLAHPDTLEFLAKNLTLLFGSSDGLPGVFTGNAYGPAVNGSLWTLPMEVRLYAVLAALWAAAGLLGAARGRVFRSASLALAAASAAAHIGLHFVSPGNETLRLFSLFFMGVGAQLLKERIPLSSRAFLLLAAAVLAASLHRGVFFVVYHLSVAYLTLFAAYAPLGALHGYNRFGDYSYGIYIYAFPVQQALEAGLPGLSVPAMMGLSFTLTAALAALSWHAVEKPALELKGPVRPDELARRGLRRAAA